MKKTTELTEEDAMISYGDCGAMNIIKTNIGGK